MLLRFLFTFLLALASLPAATGFLDAELTLGGKVWPYQVYVPRDYTPSRPWPVILYLHGIGQRGADGLTQTTNGLPDAIRQYPSRYPAIVVIPQVPIGSAWAGESLAVALAALDRATAQYRTDRDRVYLTGLSMGGLGSYLIALREPARFAAIVILCAAFEIPASVPPDLMPLLAIKDSLIPPLEKVPELWKSRTPLRIYAGGRDTLVPPAKVLITVEAIRQSGASVDFRELPSANHNVWDPVYRDPEFPTWLFAQQRPAP